MQETPIAQLARRWVTRKNRPAGELPCAASGCREIVLDGDGICLADARSIACSADCVETIEAERRAW